MLCPKCHSDRLRTIESRPASETTVYRRRQCQMCFHGFNTTEHLTPEARPPARHRVRNRSTTPTARAPRCDATALEAAWGPRHHAE